jgi:hypothetical protein
MQSLIHEVNSACPAPCAPCVYCFIHSNWLEKIKFHLNRMSFNAFMLMVMHSESITGGGLMQSYGRAAGFASKALRQY